MDFSHNFNVQFMSAAVSQKMGIINFPKLNKWPLRWRCHMPINCIKMKLGLLQSCFFWDLKMFDPKMFNVWLKLFNLNALLKIHFKNVLPTIYRWFLSWTSHWRGLEHWLYIDSGFRSWCWGAIEALDAVVTSWVVGHRFRLDCAM